MEEGNVLLGFLLYASHHGFSGAITAVCAMWFSTLLPNRFAAATAPLVIYFTLLRIRNWGFPSLIDPVYWNNRGFM